MATQLILIDAVSKNGRTFNAQIAVDVSDITSPISINSDGLAVVMVKSNVTEVHSLGGITNIDTWLANNTLSQISSQSNELDIIDVVARTSSVSTQQYNPAEQMVFNLSNIVGTVRPTTPVGGSLFEYKEAGNPLPVLYETNITPAALVAALPVIGGLTSFNGNTGPAITATVVNSGTAGTLQWNGTQLEIPQADTDTTGLLSDTDWDTFDAKFGGAAAPDNIPYVSAAGVLSDSWLSRTADGTVVSAGTVLRSPTINQGQIAFPTDDSVLISTDGAAQLTSRLFVDATSDAFTLANSNGAVQATVTSLSVSHAALTRVDSVNARTDYDGATNIITSSSDAGTLAEGWSQITPTGSTIGWAAEFIDVGQTITRLIHSAEVNVVSPITRLTSADVIVIDNVNIDAGLNETIRIGAVNADLIELGRSGENVSVLGYLQTAASAAGQASMNIPAGTAPAAPVDGDLWSTATAAELKMRQNGSSNTLLGASAVTAEVVVSDTTVTVLINGTAYKLLAVPA